jgi:uncharacterized protein
MAKSMGPLLVPLAQIPPTGLQRTVDLELSALPRLTELHGPQQGRLRAELLLKNREGNVEVTGRLLAEVVAPCQRCLEPVPLPLDEAVRVALAPRTGYARQPDDVRLGSGELEVSFYDGEELDLLNLVEDEVLLLIPDTVAEEDETGRCLVCGKLVDELFQAPSDAKEDHPFAPLKRMMTGEE